MTTPAAILAAVIEIDGLWGVFAVLAPFALLAIVILRAHRQPPPPEPATAVTAAMLRDSPSGDPSAVTPAADTTAKAIEEAQPVDWALRIQSAEAGNDHATLAELHLSAARAELAADRPDAAAEHLRSSVRAAVKSRNAPVQAEARLELAEIARTAGDLTTACEHWQIARSLFHDLKQETRRDDTGQLMQKHGCPTDWVLTDF